MHSDGGATDSNAAAINSRGEVAGEYYDGSSLRGFIYDNGTYTTLNAPRGAFANPDAINNRGEVAGDYANSSGAHGFLYDNGTFTTPNVVGATETVPLS